MEFTPSPYGTRNINNQYFPRLLGVYMDHGASSYYRIQVPFKLMAECGYPVGWGHVDDLCDVALDAYDAVVISRAGGDPVRIQTTIDGLKREGKTVFVDYDDNFFAIPAHNPARSDTSGVRIALQTAHGAIATNATLAAVLQPHAKQVAILPNYVDSRVWPTVKPVLSDKLIIGVTGSASHVQDWQQIAEPMRRIRQEFAVDFLVGGFLPDYLEDLATITMPWMPLREYPLVMNGIDIGLCPLDADVFNRSKSPIKAYEFGMAGAAVVASPTQYGPVVRGRGTIAESEEAWYQAIKRYIVNKTARESAGRALKQYVEQRVDVARHAVQIAQTYRTLYRNAIGTMQVTCAA